MNAGFMPEGLPDFSDGFDIYAGWEITRKGDNSLTPEQNRLLAYGAPLFLYNDDNVDSLESTAGTDTLKEMLEEWWEVTDRKSALETISWLLNEGQHAGADPAWLKSASVESRPSPRKKRRTRTARSAMRSR